MIGIVIATMVSIFGLPMLAKRYTTGRLRAVLLAVPTSLFGVVVGTVIEHAIIRTAGSRTTTVGDTAEISGDLPRIIWLDDDVDLPPFDGDTLGKIAPFAVILAAIGLVETLMTLKLVDQITQTDGMPNKEAVAQVGPLDAQSVSQPASQPAS